MRTKLLQTFVVSIAFGMLGCELEETTPDGDSGDAKGGDAAKTSSSGGSSSKSSNAAGGKKVTAAGGAEADDAAGGSKAAGKGGAGNTGNVTGGSKATGRGGAGNTSDNDDATGGKRASSKGGVGNTSDTRASTGGRKSTTSTGGAKPGAGGSGDTGSGGKSSTGGAATGGKSSSGGAAAGGKSSTGGAATGGKSAAGGASTTNTSTPAVNCSGPSLNGGTTYSSNGSGNVAGGYHYELWRDGNGGNMTVFGVGAAFKATWANSGDFLARVGLKYNETQTHDQIGTFAADYAFKKSGTGGGYSFIGIYGWTNSPLVEYYIVEDWFGGGPPTGGGSLKGSFEVDGGKYNIYTYTRVNMPSIKGTSTFPQFFSVRQTARQCGHISISEHFKQWAKVGLNLGKMYECKILVEAGGGSGSLEFTTASLTATK